MAQDTEEQGKITNEGGKPTLRLKLPVQPPTGAIDVTQKSTGPIKVETSATYHQTTPAVSVGKRSSAQPDSAAPGVLPHQPATAQPSSQALRDGEQERAPARIRNQPTTGGAGSTTEQPAGDGSSTTRRDSSEPERLKPPTDTDPPSATRSTDRAQQSTKQAGALDAAAGAAKPRWRGRRPDLSRLNALRQRFGFKNRLSRQLIQGLILRNPLVLLAIVVGAIAVTVLVIGFVMLWQTHKGDFGSGGLSQASAYDHRDDILVALAKAGDLPALRELLRSRGQELLDRLQQDADSEKDPKKKEAISQLRTAMISLKTAVDGNVDLSREGDPQIAAKRTQILAAYRRYAELFKDAFELPELAAYVAIAKANGSSIDLPRTAGQMFRASRNGGARCHLGYDFSALAPSTTIVAGWAGTVVAAGFPYDIGVAVSVSAVGPDNQSYRMIYGHLELSSITKKEGDTVAVGEVLGRVFDYANAHLDMKWHRDGQFWDYARVPIKSARELGC